MARKTFGSIIKRGQSYHGRWRKNGHEYYTATVSTRTEAQQLLDLVHSEIVRGEWNENRIYTTEGAKQKIATIKEWIPYWVEYMETLGKSPNTIRTYRSRWVAHIAPYFGENTQLAHITSLDIHKFLKHLNSTQSPASARSIMRDFSAGLTAAQKLHVIKEKPQMPDGFFSKPSRRPNSYTTYSYKEIKQIIEATPERYRAAIVAASLGCLRSGEVAALRRKDCGKTGDWIEVSRATKRDRHGQVVVGPPKSNAGYRTIQLDGYAAGILKYHLDTFTPPGKDALLFPPLRYPAKFITDKALRNILHKACEDAGLPVGRFHDLRHSGLTLYGRAGATIADLMARAGHSDPKTVMIYQHSSARRDAELAARMAAEA